MERKLIQLANKTLVVSIPHLWAKKHKLKKGDSIESIDKDGEILLKLKKNENKKVTIDARGQSKRYLKRAFSAAYKTGYNEINILFDSEQTRSIDELPNEYIGIILLSKDKKSAIVHSSIDPDFLDFETYFKKTFFLTISISEEILAKLNSKNRAALEDLLKQKKDYVKHLNLALRLLNTKNSGGIKETNIYFCAVILLDSIIDFYFRLITEYLGTNEKIDEELFLKVNLFLKKTYESYFLDKEIKEAYLIRGELFEKRHHNNLSTILKIVAKQIIELNEIKLMLDFQKIN